MKRTNLNRRTKIAARKRAAEIVGELIALQDRAERLQGTYAKRSMTALDECGRHVEIIATLPHSNTSEAVNRRKQRASEAVEAALVAFDRLTERCERTSARINSRIAHLLEELRPALRGTETRERARLVATFSFWLQKTKGRN
jgi:hypothetical protein